MQTTEVIAVAGIIGTLLGALGGPWLQSAQAARRAETERIRTSQHALYVDIAAYLQYEENVLEYLTGDENIRERRHSTGEKPDLIQLSARVRLLATQPIRDAWAHFVGASATLEWNIREDGERDRWSGDFITSDNDQDVVHLRQAIHHLNSELRKSLGVR